MRLIDANVFIYAVGREHTYKSACLAILASVRQGAIEANTDMEVLQEILHYYQRQGDVEFGDQVLKSVLAQFPRPVEITAPTIETASRTLRTHPQLQARDALHAAVVIEHGLEGIVSADRAFDGIPGITRFDPKDL